MKICFLILITVFFNRYSFASQDLAAKIIKNNLEGFTGLPAFNSKLESIKPYLITVLPGIPLPKVDLSFNDLSGEELISTPVSIDKAYRFAKLVNKLLVAGASYNETDMQLSDLYAVRADSIKGLGESEISLSKLTSSTYNDYFYLTLAYPMGSSEQDWVDYEHNGVYLASKEVETPASTAYYKFSASLKYIKILRPWINKDIEYDLEGESKNIYYSKIIGLLLVKQLGLNVYNDEIDEKIIATVEYNGPYIVALTCMTLKDIK